MRWIFVFVYYAKAIILRNQMWLHYKDINILLIVSLWRKFYIQKKCATIFVYLNQRFWPSLMWIWDVWTEPKLNESILFTSTDEHFGRDNDMQTLYTKFGKLNLLVSEKQLSPMLSLRINNESVLYIWVMKCN